MNGPYATRVAVPAGATLDKSLRQHGLDVSRLADAGVIWARPEWDLARVCNTRGVSTVYLYSNARYSIAASTLAQPVEIIGPRSASIVLRNGLTTGKLSIACTTGRVRLVGMTVNMPIEAASPVALENLKVEPGTLATTGGAFIELAAAADRSLVLGCESAGARPLGILVNAGAAECRIVGNDFSGCTTALEATGLSWAGAVGYAANVGTLLIH